jgi:hypothetical protein
MDRFIRIDATSARVSMSGMSSGCRSAVRPRTSSDAATLGGAIAGRVVAFHGDCAGTRLSHLPLDRMLGFGQIAGARGRRLGEGPDWGSC